MAKPEIRHWYICRCRRNSRWDDKTDRAFETGPASDPVRKAFTIAQRPLALPSREITRREIETNTAQSKVAVKMHPTASSLPARDMAQRSFSIMLFPEKEKGVVDINPTIAKNHQIENIRCAIFN
ncbi:hypothetical protein QCA50_005403 [Cerrena zonata]|uniref:Uncharacterized protein n=1 Tax=Cerrena zonata TaxID=2478898 RepID=A0AAW0GP38_9APHY